MAEDTAQQKTEQPTQKRLQEARQKGQVPRSKELNTLLSLVAAAVGLIFLGAGLLHELGHLMKTALGFNPQTLNSVDTMYAAVAHSIQLGVAALLPIFALFVASAFIGPAVMGGLNFSTESLSPKFDKLDPLKGVQRMFGLSSLVELVKAICKFLLVGAAAVTIIYYSLTDLIALGLQSFVSAAAHVGELLMWSFIGFSAVLILVALIDVPYQLWQYKDQLMMTRQEVKDELKDSEGRPEVKGQLKRLQRQMADQRMMDAVPKADVIITNPTHYAVALSYNQDGWGAPRVVAKGQDFVAQRIREVATEHEVPLFEAPPLARALYFMVKVGQEIPNDLYRAVAQVLAYIYQLKNLAPTAQTKPVRPRYFDVPQKFQGEWT